MFLHSGASLHGHEYSKRSPPTTVNAAAPRRNSLLRSSFGAPIRRTSTYSDTNSLSSPSTASTGSTEVRQAQPDLDHGSSPITPQSAPSRVPEHAPVHHTEPEAMSEDELSSVADISDSDVSRTASSRRRRSRRAPRQTTSYLLAHAPPTLGRKQRLIHVRPKLLLQLQQISVGQRPKPAIDVYPSFAIANTSIAAHLCKRFPRLSRIRNRIGIQDILLLKSEDYNADGMEEDSEGDEESMKNRDIVAILSPLTGMDKAEIALPDGTVWVAAPRANGSSLSYEFTTVDEHGQTMTARWVRRQVVNRSSPNSVPPTPTTAPMSPATPPVSCFLPPQSPSLEHKFTFSIINPDSRRHPIMATLQPTSLQIQDTYTTVSQSSGRYPPTSPLLGTLESERPADQRSTQPVEEWQRSFIEISALWVALRHGWVPHFRTADFVPTSPSIPLSDSKPASTHTRARSQTIGIEPISRFSKDLTGRLKQQSPSIRQDSFSSIGSLPRRATSTGAARMQRLRARKLSEANEGSESDSPKPNSRRILSADWNGNVGNRRTFSSMDGALRSPQVHKELPTPDPRLATPSTNLHVRKRRAVSEQFSPDQVRSFNGHLEDQENGSQHPSDPPQQPLFKNSQENESSRHHVWRHMSNWFHKLRAR